MVNGDALTGGTVRPNRLAGLGFLALLWPSGAMGVFKGVPLDTLPEFAGLVVVCASVLAGRSNSVSRRAGLLVLAVALLSITLKTTLFLGGAHDGFAACYRVLLPEEAPSCGRSWRNPFRLQDVTRFDERIAFHLRGQAMEPPLGLSDSTWNLSMFNDLAFNFYPWEEGVRVRERLPFSARWTWRSEEAGRLRIRYVGELTVTVDGRPRRFPSAYAAPADVQVPVSQRGQDVAVGFRFDDGSVQPWQEASPYAMVEVRDDDGLAEPAPPPWWSQAAALLSDAMIAALVAVALRCLLARLRDDVAALATAGGLLVLAARAPPFGWIAMTTLVLLLCWRRPESPRWARLPAVAVGAGAASAAIMLFPRRHLLDLVALRNAGDDFLTYESFARAILDSGSLRAGEGVFVYSPGFRYVLASLRLLLGEGDVLVSTAAYAVLLFSAAFLVVTFLPRLPAGRGPAWGAWARCGGAVTLTVLLFALLSTGIVPFAVWAPLSEWPTWAALLVALPLLFAGDRRAQLTGCVLLAVCVTIRVQQAPALLLVFGLFAAWLVREADERRHLLRCAAVFAGVVALPALHNLVYGGELVLLPRTPQLPVNFPLPFADLPRVFGDAAVARTLADQLAGVLYLMPRGDTPVDPALSVLLHAIQLVWLGMAAWVLVHRWRTGAWPHRAAFLLVPAAYLLPHVFVQVYVYYPRHIVAGYLAALAVTIAMLADDGGPRLARGPLASRGDTRHGAMAAR